jgi:fatty-acyl-CoA synthase
MNIVDAFVRAAQSTPQADALLSPAACFTYEQLLARVARLAGALVARGVQPGDIVGFNGAPADHVCLSFAVAWAGGVSVQVNPIALGLLSRAVRLAALIEIEKGQLDERLPVTRFRAVLSELDSSRSGPPALQVRNAEDTWRIAFSSGTTGTPKAVAFSHSSAIAKSELLGACAELGGWRTLVVCPPALPFGMSFWMRELSRGACVAVGWKADSDLAAALDRCNADLLVSTSANVMPFAQSLKARQRRCTHALQRVVLGGAPLPRARAALLRHHVCDNLWNVYGASEVGVVALLGPQLMEQDADCAGRLMPWVEVQGSGDADQDGASLLRFRSPTMASGYVMPPSDASDESLAFRKGWFHSQDRGRVTSDGIVHLAAREDDVINVDGNKIDPARIERVLGAIPGILECAVVAKQQGELLTALVAAYVSDTPLDGDDLKRRCRAQLRPEMVPTAFVRFPSLPRNPAGKVLRREIAERLVIRVAPQP